MTRLVSSRLHRCYSHRGVVKSTRIEKISNIVHVIACFGILFCRDLSFLSSPPPFFTPSLVRILSSFLLLLVHSSDVYATFIAHRKFYRWTKPYKRPVGFLSVPSKVDALAAVLYLCASVTLFASASGLIGKPWTNGMIPTNINFVFCTLSLVAAFINIILSLPSLDINVPSSLERLHNAIIAIYCLACAAKIQCILVPATSTVSPDLLNKFVGISFAADAMIVFAAFINVLRAIRFLHKTGYWAADDMKSDQERARKGLLAWFKSKPATATVEASDLDSEEADDYEDFDDEEWQKVSPRRSVV